MMEEGQETHYTPNHDDEAGHLGTNTESKERKQGGRRRDSVLGLLENTEKRTLIFLGAIFWIMVIVVVAAVLGVLLTSKNSSTTSTPATPTPVPARITCTKSFEEEPKKMEVFERLCPFFDEDFPTGDQVDGLTWMVDDDRRSTPDELYLQRFVMAIVFGESSLPKTTACDWDGVGCDDGSNITSIDITWPEGYEFSLVPSELAMLTALTSLKIALAPEYCKQNEGVQLPPALGGLSNLKKLEFAYIASGSFPTEFGGLTQLTSLRIVENMLLTGTIPTELGELILLTNLKLVGNGFSKQIPAQLGELGLLIDLDLSNNKIVGSIPSEFGGLTSLTSLRIFTYWEEVSNTITGIIPTQLGDMTSLTGLYLAWNDLTGTIPTEFGELTLLTYLDLSLNDLTGTIPTELGDSTSLIHLSLAYNDLTGTIPTEFGELSLLTYRNLANGNNLKD